MGRGKQLERQWRLLQLLGRSTGISVDEAAQELGCAVRTVWRDLRVLQAVRFPIYDERHTDGRHSVFKVREDFWRRLPLELSLAELAALIMSRELLAPAAALHSTLASSLDKISKALTPGAIKLLDQMREVIGVRALGAKLQAPAAEHVERIERALLERKRLHLKYYSMSRDEETERRVDPYHLTLHAGGVYLVAHCHLRGEPRIFAVERIRECRLLPQRFERPAQFDVGKYLEGAWGILRGDVVTVRVHFAPSLARYIRDRSWHPTQDFHDLPDGRLEMRMQVADTLEVRRWILGFGKDVEIVEPAALRESLRQEAEALVRKLTPLRKLGTPALRTTPPDRRPAGHLRTRSS